MTNVVPFPAHISDARASDDRAELDTALAGLAGHLDLILMSLGQSLILLDRANLLSETRAELTLTARRAKDLADWLTIVRQQLPGLPPEQVRAAVAPLVSELDRLDQQAHAILRALPDRITHLLRRG